MLDKTGELAGISGFFWGADSFKPGTNQYYEKTSVLSQASGLTNSTPNIINATYTDARGRKVGTITYGATASAVIQAAAVYCKKRALLADTHTTPGRE